MPRRPGVDPELLAGGRVERDERLVLRQHVHRAADDDRIELVDVVVADRIGPRHLQAGDVLRRDLAEVDEFRGVGAAAVVLPLARGLGEGGWTRRVALLRATGCLHEQRADDGDGGAGDDREMAGARTPRDRRRSGRSEVRRHHGQPFPVGPAIDGRRARRARRTPGPGVCVSCNGLCAPIVCSARERVKREGAPAGYPPSVALIARAVSIT